MEKSDTYQGVSATSANGVVTEVSPREPSATTQTPKAQPESEASDKKIGRTPGLRIFDVLLYPILTNFAVFGLSVAATYLTNKGANRDAAGKLIHGNVGKFFHERGQWLKGKFTGMGMTENQADMSKMVAFSFVDGSLMAPVVKVFEDRREHIGRAIDKKLGTCPEDDSVYDAEPKHSWLSVLGGRLATVSVVVPTAVALDKTGLNDTLFTKPGHKFGQYIATKPNMVKRLGKLDIPELGKIGAFEAFYTSVCTAGIYFSSRIIARLLGEDRKNKQEKATGDDTNTAAGSPPSDQGDEQVRIVAKSCDPKDRSNRFADGLKKGRIAPAPPAPSFTQRLDTEIAADHSRA